MNRYILCLFALALVLSGCSLTNSPLVYTSKQTVGVEASGNPAEVGMFTVNIGFKNHDFAFVPTTVQDADGTIKDIRGTYDHNHTKNSTQPGIASAPDHSNNNLLFLPEELSPSKNVTSSSSIEGKGHLHNVFFVDPSLTGKSGMQDQKIRDALSVFGSFSNDTSVGTTTNVSIGKVFSTGVAAQHLTEGLGLKESRSALASVLSQRAACITALKAANSAVTQQDIDKSCLNIEP
jgi:hypothetical protein